jgi:hypothetical protein
VAAVDLAFMGADSAQMAVGRWGLASGYNDCWCQWCPYQLHSLPR